MGKAVKVKGRKKKRRGTPADDDVIVTRGIVKVFGDLRAVDGVDLTIKRGCLYGLLGPNGSGKTTTIKMLMGLLKITEGEARVLGNPMPDKGLMSRIGYMPQETAVYREITVHDNISLFAELYGVPPYGIAAREESVLRLVDLWEWKKVLAENLSGGMMHRLSLACCLLHDPEVLFLDEPTVGVDPQLRDSLWGHFKDLAAEGKTMIITTHYIEEARHCDLVGLMRNGKVIAEDTPRALMERAGTGTLEDAFLYFTRELEGGKGRRRKRKRVAGGGEG